MGISVITYNIENIFKKLKVNFHLSRYTKCKKIY